MSARIKICGLFRMEDIAYANEVKPDYVGFVFAKSRRQVNREMAAKMRKALAPGILAAGVLTILEMCELNETADVWELLWIWTTGIYLFWALLVLFFSQKLIDVLRIAMEAEHTV